MNHFDEQFDGRENAGRKGVAYDWQSLVAADGVAAIEAELSVSSATFALELAE